MDLHVAFCLNGMDECEVTLWLVGIIVGASPGNVTFPWTGVGSVIDGILGKEEVEFCGDTIKHLLEMGSMQS